MFKIILIAMVVLAMAFGLNAEEVSSQGLAGPSSRKKIISEWVEGKTGKALKFDGTTYVQANDNPSLNFTEELTISFWIYPVSWNKKPGRNLIINKGLDEQWGFDLNYNYPDTIDQMRFYINLDKKRKDIFAPGSAPELGKWTHLTVTYDKKNIRIYKNGEPLELSGGANTGPIGVSSAPLRISDADSFKGLVDEVYVFNRAISDDEVKKIYENQEVSKTGLVGLWRFEEGKGIIAADLSGNKNTGYLSWRLAIDEELSEIKNGIDALDKLIKQAGAEGIEIPCQKISLNTARTFFEIIKMDANDGRKEEVAAFELDEVPKIIEKAIKEVKTIIKEPDLQIKVSPFDAKDITIKNGAFYSGNIPTFIGGFYGHAPLTSEQKELGANLFGGAGGAFYCSSRIFMTGWNEINETGVTNYLLPFFNLAEKENLVLVHQIFPKAPSWLAKEAPGIDKAPHRVIAVDIDHPLVEKLIDTYYSEMSGYFGSYAWLNGSKERPNLLCHVLTGEEALPSNFVTEYTAKRYAEWLKERYEDVERLNKIWTASYKDFKEAAEEQTVQAKAGKSLTNRATFYDWHIFNQHRLTTFYRQQISAVKRGDPKALTSRWLSGVLTDKSVNRHLAGVDTEAAIRMCPISGWDGGIYPSSEITKLRTGWQAAGDYCLAWQSECQMCDFAKSLAPDQPFFNIELHSVSGCAFTSPLGISPDFLRTGLWLGHLHGMGAHSIWRWGRRPFVGGELMTQPPLVEIWGRTMLELNRFASYVILFPQLERKTRILYSEASCIQSASYMDEMDKLYEALYFLDYPAGFITEEMIKEGKLKDCSLLVIPSPTYVKEETVSRIKEYQGNGGMLVIGGEDSLKYDEYGKERNISSVLKEAASLTGSTPKDYSDQLDKFMDRAGIKRPVRLLDKEGKNIWGVELRTAIKDGKRIVYLVNLNKKKVEITLRTKGKKKIRDIIGDRIINPDSSFILNPMELVFLEVN